MVALIASGGTIAMKIDPVKQAPVPAISGKDPLAAVPGVGWYAKIEDAATAKPCRRLSSETVESISTYHSKC